MKETAIRQKVKKELQFDGFLVWYPPRTRWSGDIFTIFDLIAWKKDKMVMIQLTTYSNMSARCRKIRNYCKLYSLDYPEMWVWGWNAKKKEFRKIKVVGVK